VGIEGLDLLTGQAAQFQGFDDRGHAPALPDHDGQPGLGAALDESRAGNEQTLQISDLEVGARVVEESQLLVQDLSSPLS
jgi:hypothetical protein